MKASHRPGAISHLQSVKGVCPGVVVPRSLRKGRHAAALNSPEPGRGGCGGEGARARLLLGWQCFYYRPG